MQDPLAYYRRVVTQEPSNIDAWLQLGAIWKSRQAFGKSVECYAYAARLFAHKGLFVEALTACKTVLSIDPHHRETQQFMAGLYTHVSAPQTPLTRSTPQRGPRITPPHITRPRQRQTPPPTSLQQSTPNTPPRATTPHPTSQAQSSRFDPSQIVIDMSPGDISPSGSSIPTPPPSQRSSSQRAVALHPPSSISSSSNVQHHRNTPPPGRAPNPIPQNDLSYAEQVLHRAAQPPQHSSPSVQARSTPPADATVVQASPFFSPSQSPGHLSASWSEIATHTPAAPPYEDATRLEPFPSSLSPDSISDEPIAQGPDLPNAKPIRSKDIPGLRARLPLTTLFSRLKPETFTKLLTRMSLRHAPKKTIILDAKKPIMSLFLIINGRVRVLSRAHDGKPREVARMGRGDFFGEFYLLTGKDSRASVVAANDTDMLELSREVVQEIAQHDPKVWSLLWDFYHERLINNLLARSELFGGLNTTARKDLMQRFKRAKVPARQTIIKEQGTSRGLYLVMRGSVQVSRGGQVLGTLHEGELFGAVAAFTGEPSSATVQTTEETTLLALLRHDILEIAHNNPPVAEAWQAMVARRKGL